MANILSIGIATLDIINTVEHFPAEDEEMRVLSQQQLRGGNATNTLSILSQLEHQCTWAGVLIDEPDSQIIQQDLAKHKIDSSHCRHLSSGKMPTSYITLNQQSGSRTIIHHRDCPEFSFADFKKIDLNHYDWVHFEGRNCSDTIKMLHYCSTHHPQLPCSVEIEKQRPDIQTLIPFADIVFFSRHYAESHGFTSAADFLNSLNIAIKASCAWGEQGAWLIDENKHIIHSPASPPKKVIDTLGAVDTFNAALIDSFINKRTNQSALNFACQLAGYKCGLNGLNITNFTEK